MILSYDISESCSRYIYYLNFDHINMPVTVLVGKEKHAFHLDEDQLCKYSVFFNSALRGGLRRVKNLLCNSQRQTSRHFRFSRNGYSVVRYQESRTGSWHSKV